MGARSQSGDIVAYAISLLAGFAVCFAVTLATGKREAWDAAEYFSIGIPTMCVVIFILSYRFPLKSWRWALSMAIGQSVAIVVAGGSPSLWPLSVIAMTVVSVPQFLAALAASKLAQRKRSSSI